MNAINLYTPLEVSLSIASYMKEKRLVLNLSQQTLSQKAGISYGVLKKFERTGQISFLSLLKSAHALGILEDFQKICEQAKRDYPSSLDALMKDNIRKRGRT